MTFLISWNVAGWESTVVAVRKHFGSLSAFFNRLQAEVVCLQEVKQSWPRVKKDPVNSGAADPKGLQIEGWESFWAMSVGKRSFNGVATFAKKGLVHKADPRPFKDDVLDDEGRCIVTQFSHFVVVNVYVVNSRGGERSEFKAKFLAALAKLLERLRKDTQLPVVLCGDLNMTYKSTDAHWSHRKIPIRRLLFALGSTPAPVHMSQELQAAASQSQQTPTRSQGGQPVPSQSFEAEAVQDENDLETLRWFASQAAEHLRSREPHEGRQDSERVKALKARPPPTTPEEVLETLRDFEAAEGSVLWLEKFIRGKINREKLVRVAQLLGLCPHSRTDATWMKQRMQPPVEGGDGMIDTFAQLYPDARCAYTCWDQYRNRRYSNEGNRIDFILVDKPLFVPREECAATLQGEWMLPYADPDEASDEAGILRVTARGVYQPAPQTGEGMAELPDAHKELQFAGLGLSGQYVSPPQYSDHIGVTHKFPNITLQPRKAGAALDKITSGCRYASGQPTIMSMFSRQASSSSATANNGNAKLSQSSSPLSPASPTTNGTTTSRKVSVVDGGSEAPPTSVPRRESTRPAAEVICISDDD